MDFMRLLQGVFIEGKADGQAGGPPNIEQPIMVQNKKLKKINDYDIILPIGVPSNYFGILIIQNHDFVFGEVEIGGPSLLNINDKLYVREHILDNVFTNETQENNMRDQDVI